MKKALTLLTAFVFVGLVACGPSAEDQAAIEQARADSARIADSTENALLQQAAEAAAAEPAAVDSTALAANPEHGAEGHVCGPDCAGMEK